MDAFRGKQMLTMHTFDEILAPIKKAALDADGGNERGPSNYALNAVLGRHCHNCLVKFLGATDKLLRKGAIAPKESQPE